MMYIFRFVIFFIKEAIRILMQFCFEVCALRMPAVVMMWELNFCFGKKKKVSVTSMSI